MSLNNTTDAELIAYLNYVSAQINRTFPVIIFFVGTIGNILNILTLSQKRLREIPCVFLFLASSIFSLISIDFGLITRVLSGFAEDPTYTIGWLCKLRTFIVFSTRAMVFWSFVLATVDRWLSSSVEVSRRQLSSLKNAHRGTILVIVVSMIVYGELLYCYDANLINSPFKCYAKNYPCQLTADMTFVCYTTIAPIIVMLIFGLLTIINVRQSQSRLLKMTATSTNQTTVATTTAGGAQERSKSVERRLLLMIFVQVIVLGSLTLPQAIQRLYAVFAGTGNNPLEATIDSFVYNFVLLLTYLASAMQFYIYTLTGGTLFRKAVLDVIKSTMCCCRR
jgi:hypothetical protein